MISPKICHCIHPFFREYAPVSTPSSLLYQIQRHKKIQRHRTLQNAHSAVQVTEFDPCFASSLHHWLWVHQNSQLYFTVLDVTFDFVLKLVLALFSGRAEILPKNNLYRALTKIYVANKHNKSGFKIKKIITYVHEQIQFGIDCLFAKQISENFSVILNMILVLHFILQFLKSRDLS